jgi:dienelactone hydrolase
MKRLLAFVATKAFTLIVATVVLACSSCSGGNSSSNTTPPITVLVTPASATVQAGATAQFTATVTNDGANKGVTWTVSCSTASCGSVSATSTASGVATIYSAPATPGSSLSVTLTASSVADGTRPASANITVPAPISVSVAPGAATVQPGATARFTATVANDPANAGVTWNVSCSPALTGEPGMPCGKVFPTSTLSGAATTYTAPTAGDLIVTITAASMTNGNSLASATIIIRGIAVSVVPGSATLKVGGTAQFTATVINDATNQGVTWTLLYTQNGTLVPCPSAAVCGSVSPATTASGAATTYAAPTAPLAGNFEVAITATALANSAASAQAFATVSGITVSITPSTASIPAGVTQQFTATVSNDSTSSGVNWTLTQNGTSCSPGCGTITPSTTASGVATTYSAPATPPPSNLAVTVTATSVALSAASGSATVIVLAITISVAPASALLPGGTTQQFTPTVSNDVTSSGVTWMLTENSASCTPGCGTISPTSTASGTATTYSAPLKLSASATAVLTAASVRDTTKSRAAVINLSIGTVKIVPDSLAFGRFLVNQGGSSQATVLTNTGSTTLSIAIIVTGADPGDFSQTNTCGSSVGAGVSCTITVFFHPRAIGIRSALLSISDNSPDSPQQVSLSGSGYTRALVDPTPVRSALAGSGTATVPSPTGPNIVGTRVVDLVDSTRIDPFLTNGTNRELLVRFWYPAAFTQACKPADYTSQRVWNYFSQLLGIALPEVRTNSCLDTPVTDGAHPVVVFTPGYTGTFTDYTFLFEDLASRGYIVASVDHTYEATAVEFLDGRLVKSVLGSHLGGTWRGDEQTFSFAVSARLNDLQFVINELQRLNVQADSPFAGQLDLSRMAVAGHSMGGSTALLAAEQEPRFKAAIVIDGVLQDSLASSTETPILLLAAGREQWSDAERRVWNGLHGSRLAVNLKGAEHVTPTDEVWLASNVIKTGSMGPEKTIAAIRNYIAAFLDTNLLDKPMDPLLTGSSSEYPDAEVTTQHELLQAKPINGREALELAPAR